MGKAWGTIYLIMYHGDVLSPWGDWGDWEVL